MKLRITKNVESHFTSNNYREIYFSIKFDNREKIFSNVFSQSSLSVNLKSAFFLKIIPEGAQSPKLFLSSLNLLAHD